MSMKHKKMQYWFTFIELIIAITIIAILSVLWFMSYSSHLSSSRDSIRKSELSDIYSMMDSYKIKAPLMLPDKRIDIYSSWILLWFQWYLSNSILSNIWFKGTWKDPLDNVFYTYFLTKDFRNEWLLGFLENDDKNESYLNSNGFWVISQANAIDYTGRVPIIVWKKLGILLDDNNTPIQENPVLQATWKIELSTLTSNYVVYFDDKTSISNTTYSMDVIYGTSVTWIIWNSCDQYIEENNWEFMRSWYYLINSSTWITETYCNMWTTTWSWILTRIATCSWIMPSSSYATKWNTYLQTYDWTNWLPIVSWAENQIVWCDFNCNSDYTWSGAINTCLQKINWMCWSSNWLNIITNPVTWLCSLWNASAVTWPWPSTWTCNWINWWTTASCSTTTYCMIWGMFPCNIY